MPVRTVIVGLGSWAEDHHLRILSNLPNYEIYAVCDLDEARSRSVASRFGARPFTDYQELIRDPKVDLVLLCTPGHNHKDMAIAALSHGRNIVVEKPMCLSVREADEMIAAAKESGKLLTVFQNRRWDKDFLAVRKVLEEGLLGEVFLIKSSVVQDGGYYPGIKSYQQDWRCRRNFGGGVLYDWGPHLIDQMVYMIQDKPLSIHCETKSKVFGGEVEDYFRITLRYPGDLTVELESSWDSHLDTPRWFVLGTKATLKWCWDDPLIIKGEIEGQEKEIQIPDLRAPSDPTCFWDDVYEALSTGREPCVTLQQARGVISLIEAARMSAQRNEVIRLAACP